MPLIRFGSQASGFSVYGINPPSCSVKRRDRDRVEMGDAVGLGPQRDLARSGEGAVLGREQSLVLERNGEAVTFGAQSEGMPLVRGNLEIGALDLLPATLHNAVKADIVFESVGTDDVVIVRARQPHRNAARLVDLAGDRLEMHADLDI